MITKGKVGRSSACKGEDSFDGLVFSALATVGQITIVGKQVYDMTGSELNLGLLGLAEFLPVALLSLSLDLLRIVLTGGRSLVLL